MKSAEKALAEAATKKANLKKTADENVTAAKGNAKVIATIKAQLATTTDAVNTHISGLNKTKADSTKRRTDAEATRNKLKKDMDTATKKFRAALTAAKADYEKKKAGWEKTITAAKAALDALTK